MGEKTSIGLDENIVGLLCYVLGVVTGIVFYLIEKENKFVRFHAVQSIIVFGSLTAINWIIVPIIFQIPFLGMLVGGLLAMLTMLLGLVLWIVLMVKAYQGERYLVPIAGELAEKYI